MNTHRLRITPEWEDYLGRITSAGEFASKSEATRAGWAAIGALFGIAPPPDPPIGNPNRVEAGDTAMKVFVILQDTIVLAGDDPGVRLLKR